MTWNRYTKLVAAAIVALIPAIGLGDGLRLFLPIWLASLISIRLCFNLVPQHFSIHEFLVLIRLRKDFAEPSRSAVKGELQAKLRANWLKPTDNEKISSIVLIFIPTVMHFAGFIFGFSWSNAGLIGSMLYLSQTTGFGTIAAFRRRRRRLQRELNRRATELTETGTDFILYLRSFSTSNRIRVKNTMPKTLDRLLVGAHWDIEYAFSNAFEETAPLVAIGTKGRGLGAAKITTEDAQWQLLFYELAKKARVIMIVPSLTPGTRHEIAALANTAKLRNKTIWVMPPSYRNIEALLRRLFLRSHKKTWESVRRELSPAIDLPPYRRSGGLIYAGFDGHKSNIYRADDLAEDRLRPLVEAIIATSEMSECDRAEAMRIFVIPERPRRYKIEEWTFRRWIAAAGTTSDRLVLSFLVIPFLFLAATVLIDLTGIFPLGPIVSGNMLPTIMEGDVVLSTRATTLTQGDVVAIEIKDASKKTIGFGLGRLMAKPGDHLKVEHGTVSINQTPVVQLPAPDVFAGELSTLSRQPGGCLGEDNLLPNGNHFRTLLCGNEHVDAAAIKSAQNFSEIIVPENKVYVMNDKRSNPFIVEVDRKDVALRASVVFFSIKNTRENVFSRIRWRRFFKRV